MTSSSVRMVDKVPTHVFEWRSHRNDVPLLLVVPGNPGMGHFYIPFARKLFQLGKGTYDVSVVSNAGHSPGHRRSGSRDWYSLEDQVQHKLAYVKGCADPSRPIILVGHSIGCYTIMHMLKELPVERVQRVFFLFPTIERMKSTRNGRRMSPLFTWLRLVFLFLIWLATWLPRSFHWWVMQQRFNSLPRDHTDYTVEAAVNLVNTATINNCLRMSAQEMTDVDTLDTTLLDAHVSKITFYYGITDHWVPPDAYSIMSRRYPQKDIVRCTNGYKHAFVLGKSNEMAEFVYNKIRKFKTDSKLSNGVKLL